MHKLQTNAQVIKIHLYNAEIREIWQFVKYWAFLWTKYKTNLTRWVYRVGPQESPSFVANAVQLLSHFNEHCWWGLDLAATEPESSPAERELWAA